MEKFGARFKCPLDTCLEEVEKSDIYIGIIGYKYGSLDKITKKSFTELEYEKAFNLGKKLILIYLMNEDECLIHPKHVDFKNHQRLVDFKKILSSRHTIDSFKSPDDLAKKIRLKLNQELPEENIGKNYRPKVLECSVHSTGKIVLHILNLGIIFLTIGMRSNGTNLIIS